MQNKSIGNINFIVNDVRNYELTYLLLAPGSSSGNFFDAFFKFFPQNELVIAPDYPGRGMSPTQADNSINAVALAIDKALREINASNVTIVALSYGTQIAIELAKLNPKIYKQILLIAPGPFFSNISRKLLTILFVIPNYVTVLLPYYRKLVIFLGLFNKDEFPDKNLREMNEQWLSNINYELSYKKILSIPIKVYKYIDDVYSKKDSENTLHGLFSNLVEVEINDKHPVTKEDYLKVFESQSFLKNL